MKKVRYYMNGSRDEAKVALTFDDGPNPPRTDQVLEILHEKGVRGAFFVIGKWARQYPRALQRIVDAGHVVGNHSYLHYRQLGDFDRAETEIAEVTGKPSRFLRPHYLNNEQACLQSPVAMSESVKIIGADVNPADYASTDSREIVRNVLESPSLRGGSIIDLHDGAEFDDDDLRLLRPLPMIEALPHIIDGLRERGLEPVGLDEMEFTDPLYWEI